jgi:DNA-binding CsgD family transcriptional regulator
VSTSLPPSPFQTRLFDLAAGATANDRFLADLLQQLRRVVRFDAAFISGADPVTGLAVSPARVENLPAEMCNDYWDTEFLDADPNQFRDLARARRPSASLIRATNGNLERSRRYRVVNELTGYGDELRTVFRTDGAVWGFASLWRAADLGPFSARDELLMAKLSRPIAEAFRRAAVARLLQTPDGQADRLVDLAPDADPITAPGLLVMNARGGLDSLNAQAEAWLNEIAPMPTTGTESQRQLPTEFVTVAARARAIAAGADPGPARARIQSRRGRWLVVHGFELTGTEPQRGLTALIIEPARASQVAHIIVEAYQLTVREQQITKLVSYGYSTDEIAARLGISSHTVRDYLKLIFEKVGVGSRGELVAKIFAEHYAAPLDQAIAHDFAAAAKATGSGD